MGSQQDAARRRRRNTIIGGIVAGLLVVGTGAVIVIGGQDDIIPTPVVGSDAGVAPVTLSLLATRDIGALPSRASWCTTARSAEHCWLLQETSGTYADTGVTGGWTLTMTGAGRQGVTALLPVDDGAGGVDWTGEKAFSSDTVARLVSAAVAADATSVGSYTFITSAPFVSTATYQTLVYHQGAAYGYEIYYDGATGRSYAYVKGTGGNKYLYSTTSHGAANAAAHCVTYVLDSTQANGFRMYVDGTDRTDYSSGNADMSAVGQFDPVSGVVNLFGRSSGIPIQGLASRARYDAVALSQANHRTICGEYLQPPDEGDTKILANDDIWDGTGSARCYAISATAASCAPGTAPAAVYDTSQLAIGWPVEPARTNRLLWNVGVTCDRWTCSNIGSNLLADGDMEAADTSAWSAGNSATLTKETADPHGGSRNLKIAYSGTNYPYAYQAVLTVNKAYYIDCWVRGDGTYAVFIAAPAGTGTVFLGTSSTSWQHAQKYFIAKHANLGIYSYATAAGYAEADDCEVYPTPTPATVAAPDGTYSAWSVDADGGYIQSASASGYSASATLYPRMWVSCSSGTLDASHIGGSGHWTVDCSSIGGSWTQIYSGHSAVTEVQAWGSTGAGALTVRFSGTDASFWAPTFTEADGLSVIPTTTAAVAIGASGWWIDNTAGNYYSVGDSAASTLTTISGTCWVVDGIHLRLSGSTPCTGIWHCLSIGGTCP